MNTSQFDNDERTFRRWFRFAAIVVVVWIGVMALALLRLTFWVTSK